MKYTRKSKAQGPEQELAGAGGHSSAAYSKYEALTLGQLTRRTQQKAEAEG
jgi:hypothetical protein